MARILQVKDFNATVDIYGMDKSYWFTTGTGAMHEPLRQKGWVVFETPKMGDKHDFARLFNNQAEAIAYKRTLI